MLIDSVGPVAGDPLVVVTSEDLDVPDHASERVEWVWPNNLTQHLADWSVEWSDVPDDATGERFVLNAGGYVPLSSLRDQARIKRYVGSRLQPGQEPTAGEDLLRHATVPLTASQQATVAARRYAGAARVELRQARPSPTALPVSPLRWPRHCRPTPARPHPARLVRTAKVIFPSRSKRASSNASRASVLTRSPDGRCIFDGAATTHRMPWPVRNRASP